MSYEEKMLSLNREIADCAALLDQLETYNFDYEGSRELSLACRELSTRYYALMEKRTELYKEAFNNYYPKHNVLVTLHQKLLKKEKEIETLQHILPAAEAFMKQYTPPTTLSVVYNELTNFLCEAKQEHTRLTNTFQKVKEEITKDGAH